MHPAVEPQTISPEDQFAILEVSLRFEWCFDSQHMDELANLLTDDMVLDHFWGYREGKKAVMELLSANVPTTRGIRYQSTNAALVPNADGSVSVFSKLLAVIVANAHELPGIAGHAIVTDVICKKGAEWKICRRSFEQMRTPAEYLPLDVEELWQAIWMPGSRGSVISI